MSKFLYHGPCDKCGSRDNRAYYDGGSYFCFGCNAYGGPNKSPYLFQSNVNDIQHDRILPEGDWQIGGGPEGEQWTQSFGITPLELLQAQVKYSPTRKQLIYCFYDDEKNLILYQARNFHPLAKQKYYTKGKPEEVLPIYYCKKDKEEGSTNLCGPRLIIVEDCLSAIKIARQSDSMPVLGSDLSLTKINRLARLYGAFLIWLDADMFHKAQRIARRFESLGCEAKAVWTPEDPKVYPDETITKVLLTGSL